MKMLKMNKVNESVPNVPVKAFSSSINLSRARKVRVSSSPYQKSAQGSIEAFPAFSAFPTNSTNFVSTPGFLSDLQACREFLQIMSVKDYRYEDPSKDLEKVIALIQSQRAYVLDDVLAAVENAVTCATKQYLKVTTAIRAAEVLSLVTEPPNAVAAAKLRAATNHVASAIDISFQLDRKAVTHPSVIAFFVAAERACPTVSKILIRRRGLAFAGRYKELVSYVGPRGMTSSQAQVLLCALVNLAADGRMESSNRTLDLLAAKVNDG